MLLNHSMCILKHMHVITYSRDKERTQTSPPACIQLRRSPPANTKATWAGPGDLQFYKWGHSRKCKRERSCSHSHTALEQSSFKHQDETDL